MAKSTFKYLPWNLKKILFKFTIFATFCLYKIISRATCHIAYDSSLLLNIGRSDNEGSLKYLDMCVSFFPTSPVTFAYTFHFLSRFISIDNNKEKTIVAQSPLNEFRFLIVL